MKKILVIVAAMCACLFFIRLSLWSGDEAALTRDSYAQLFVTSRAIEALGKIGDLRAKEVCVKGARHKEFMVRLAAAEALGRLGGKDSVRVLKELTEDENDLVKIAATKALLALGDAGSEQALFRSLAGKDPAVRADAARQLGCFGNRYASRLTSLLAEDPSEIVRVTVIERLGENRYLDAAVFLRQALNDPNTEVAKAACVALGRLRDKASEKQLRSKLKSPDLALRAAAKTGLILLQTPLPGKAKRTMSTGWLWKDTGSNNELLKAASFIGIAEAGNVRVVPLLLAALTDPESSTFLRKESAKALRIIKPRVIESASRSLGSGAHTISADNLEIGYKAGGKNLTFFLADALRNTESPFYQDAPVLLLELRATEALPALRETLLQDNPDMVGTVAFVLGEMRDAEAVAPLLAACAKFGL